MMLGNINNSFNNGSTITDLFIKDDFDRLVKYIYIFFLLY